MSIVIFEDPLVHRLNPITVGRPAYAISCGSHRLIDWVDRLNTPVRAVVRPHLNALQLTDYPLLCTESLKMSRTILLNARAVPSVKLYEVLRSLIDLANDSNGQTTPGAEGVVRYDGELALVVLGKDYHIDSSDPDDVLINGTPLVDFIASAQIPDLPVLEADVPLFQYPHDVIRHHMEILSESLEFRIANGQYEQPLDGVFVAAGAQLGEYMTVDTKAGPIILEANASIGPHCYLSGPAHVGPNARIIEHAAIKDAVALGHTTKVGGEVEASVIEPYSNKQHHGFLGHSYLGSWINLGAGTCNSDLKNTYGVVNMEYRGTKVPTGMQFVGCIMGDYSKSAINTGIFTGKTIGTCSMLYGFVTTNVPSFVNYARLFGQVTEIPADVMVATQRRMFVRRRVEQRPCDVQLVYDMFQMTREERLLAGEPLAL